MITLEAPKFDFIVIGGGTNGLSAACYLGKEGFSTLVVESSNNLGGGAITSEITLPGFKHDVFATSINIWRASSIQQDLELDKYGYRDLEPDPVASTPFRNGKAISLYRNLDLSLKSISQFSPRDSKKFKEIYDFFLESKEILLGSLASAPLSLSSMISALEESDSGLDFLQFSYLSARDWLEENFESEELKAFLALWGSNHVPLSPEDAGSALFVLVFVGLLQDKGVGVPVGGIKTLVQALRNYLESHRGTVIVGDGVTEVTLSGNRAIGIKTQNGKEFHCKKGVIASVEPKTLFSKLIPESGIPEEFRKKVARFRYSRVTQVMIHAALDKWLDYRPEDIRRSGMVQIGDSLNQISRAYNDCVIGKMPSEPFMTIDNTSCYDSSRAPAGKHTLWDFARAPVLLNGKSWSVEDKEKFADICIEKLSQYAPNAKRIILKRVVLAPQDIEKLNANFVNGDPGGGSATLDQSLALRPFPGWSQYRTPVKGLYMCGPSNHPGGGVSGLAGHNAAVEAIQDAKSDGL